MVDQSVWVPLVAALGGATIGGGVSLFAQVVSSNSQKKAQRETWAEERSRWAAEKRMEQTTAIFRVVEELHSAIAQLRIQQAYSVRAAEQGHEIPDHIVDYNQARGQFEARLASTYLDLMLLDEELERWSDELRGAYNAWLLAETGGEGVKALQNMESVPMHLKRQLSERFRDLFKQRSDLSSSTS